MSPAAPLTCCNRKGLPSESWECWGLLQMAGCLMGRLERYLNVFGDHELGNPLFPFACLLMENCLKLEAFKKKKKTEPNQSLWGCVFPSLCPRERGWDRNGSGFAVACSGNSETAWQVASFVDTLTLSLLLPLPASEWFSGPSHREKSAR